MGKICSRLKTRAKLGVRVSAVPHHKEPDVLNEDERDALLNKRSSVDIESVRSTVLGFILKMLSPCRLWHSFVLKIMCGSILF